MKNSKLDIKERSYLFALKTIKLVESLPHDPASRIISDQLLRSATSIRANIINKLSKKGSPKGLCPFGINSSPSPFKGEGDQGGEVFRQPLEAQASSSRRDFTNFINHSLKSANETKFWLGLLRDSGRKGEEAIDPLLDETKQLANILASSIITLKGF